MKKYIQPYANRTSMRHRVNAIIAVLLSVVMIVGMASGNVPAILPILKHAQAAEQTPAYVTAGLVKNSDGTGFGTTNQSFVNSENGFEVGDNGPHDGVVSSGDVVSYNLNLAFTAAKKRYVRVRWSFDDAPYLKGSGDFCYSGVITNNWEMPLRLLCYHSVPWRHYYVSGILNDLLRCT